MNQHLLTITVTAEVELHLMVPLLMVKTGTAVGDTRVYRLVIIIFGHSEASRDNHVSSIHKRSAASFDFGIFAGLNNCAPFSRNRHPRNILERIRKRHCTTAEASLTN